VQHCWGKKKRVEEENAALPGGGVVGQLCGGKERIPLIQGKRGVKIKTLSASEKKERKRQGLFVPGKKKTFWEKTGERVSKGGGGV